MVICSHKLQGGFSFTHTFQNFQTTNDKPKIFAFFGRVGISFLAEAGETEFLCVITLVVIDVTL